MRVQVESGGTYYPVDFDGGAPPSMGDIEAAGKALDQKYGKAKPPQGLSPMTPASTPAGLSNIQVRPVNPTPLPVPRLAQPAQKSAPQPLINSLLPGMGALQSYAQNYTPPTRPSPLAPTPHEQNQAAHQPLSPNDFKMLKFGFDDYLTALNHGLSTVRTVDGEIPIQQAQQILHSRTGKDVTKMTRNPSEVEQGQAQEAYNAQGMGAGKSVGFKKGQTDAQVPKGLDAKLRAQNAGTPSSYGRKIANDAQETMTDYLKKSGVSDAVAQVMVGPLAHVLPPERKKQAGDLVASNIAGLVNLPLDLAAEKQTMEDPTESADTRMGAYQNIAANVAGPEVAHAILGPIFKTLGKVAMKGGEEGLSKLKAFMSASKAGDEALATKAAVEMGVEPVQAQAVAKKVSGSFTPEAHGQVRRVVPHETKVVSTDLPVSAAEPTNTILEPGKPGAEKLVRGKPVVESPAPIAADAIPVSDTKPTISTTPEAKVVSERPGASPAETLNTLGKGTADVSNPPVAVTREVVGENPTARVESPKTTGVRNSITTAERAARGEEPVVKQEYRTPQQAQEAGEALVAAGEDHIHLAEQVAKKPRAISPDEYGVLLAGRRRLIDSYNRTGAALDNAIENGSPNVRDLKEIHEKVSDQLDINDQALIKSGRESSASLNARKMGATINEGNYAEVQQKARRLKGSKLDPAQEAKLKKATQAYNDALKRNADLEERLAQAQSAAEVRKVGRKLTAVDLDAEYEQLQKKLFKASAKISAGVDPGYLSTGGKMVINRIKRGGITAAQAIDDVFEAIKDKVPGLTKDLLRKAAADEHQATSDAAKAAREAAGTKVDQAKAQVQRELETLRKKGVGEKIATLSRMNALSGAGTFANLGAAVLSHGIVSPFEEAAGGIVKHTIGRVGGLAEKAGAELDFNPKAELEALKSYFSKENYRDKLDVLKGKETSINAKAIAEGIGQPHSTANKILDLEQRSHQFIKTGTQRNAFTREWVKQLADAKARKLDVNDPNVRLDVFTKAFEASQRGLFFNKSKLADPLSKAFKDQGQAVKAIIGIIAPIRHIPINIAARQLEFAFGLPYAAGRHLIEHGILRKELTPEAAQAISRAYKRGLVGGSMTIWGANDPNIKVDKNDHLIFYGHKLPNSASHIPVLTALKMGVYYREAKGGLDGLEAATLGTGASILTHTPYVDIPNDIVDMVGSYRDNAQSHGKKVKKAFGSLASNLIIPQGLQQIARARDSVKPPKDTLGVLQNLALGSETQPRKTNGVIDQFKSVIPGARETLQKTPRK